MTRIALTVAAVLAAAVPSFADPAPAVGRTDERGTETREQATPRLDRTITFSVTKDDAETAQRTGISVNPWIVPTFR